MGEAGDFNAEWDPPTAVQNEHLNANWEAVSQPSSAPRDPVVGPGHAPGAPFRPAVAAPVQQSVPAEGAPTMMQPATSMRSVAAPTPQYPTTQPVAPAAVQAPAVAQGHQPPMMQPGAGPEYATFARRLGARVLDFFFVLFVFVPVFVAVVWAIAVAGNVDPAVAVLFGLWIDVGLWELAYYLVGASHGQTIGMRMVGIRVCRDGLYTRIGFWKALGRQFASIISTLVLFIGWLAPLWTPKRQTWHDSMTNTVVIRDTSARLATPAVVWGLIWTVLSAAGFGALAAWGVQSFDDLRYELGSSSSYAEEGDYYGTDDPYGYSDDYGYEDEYGYEGDYADDYGTSGGYSGDNGYEEDYGTSDEYSDGYGYEDEGGDFEADPFENSGTSALSDSVVSTGSLGSIAADMDSRVRSLVGSWVVQLSSSTTDSPNQAGVEPMSEAEILDRLNGAERRYAGTSTTPLLLHSGDYNFKFSDMWVVVLDRTYPTSDAALGFCAEQGYPRDHCLAKLLDTSDVWDGTAKMMPQ